MKIIKYSLKNPFVGFIVCPECKKKIFFWRSSGMSDMWPHFYCNRCSNVYLSKSLKYKYSGCSQYEACKKLQKEKLSLIEASLPSCQCGGQYQPGANPKCQNCKHEFRHQDNPIERLSDPYVILHNNACLFSDDYEENYQIKIEVGVISKLKNFLGKFGNK